MARKRRDRRGEQTLLPVMRVDAAGIDIGATEHPDRAMENVRSFPNFTQDLWRNG